jgi:hypothetical protein
MARDFRKIFKPVLATFMLDRTEDALSRSTKHCSRLGFLSNMVEKNYTLEVDVVHFMTAFLDFT